MFEPPSLTIDFTEGIFKLTCASIVLNEGTSPEANDEFQ